MVAVVAVEVAEGAVVAEVDRVGIGWRPRLAAGILSNLDRIDIVEVIADDYFDASSAKLDSLRILSAQTPVTLHGIGLGMASTIPVDAGRLGKFAKLFDFLHPESWSEHLAFVRAGDIEIGHLASPPRNAQSVDGTLRNLAAAVSLFGVRPIVENIATLVDPPGSWMSESAWLTAVTRQSKCPLLLDLHNVHTNSINFGYDAVGMIESLPLDEVGAIHIAGGKYLGNRILDDHLHDVPDPVYDLLRLVASRTVQPLTVILERDGAYPSMNLLLEQLDRARAAIAIGRTQAEVQSGKQISLAREFGSEIMSTPEFERLLARLYCDSQFRNEFLTLPGPTFARTGLTQNQCDAMASIDKPGLLLAAQSFAYKREKQKSLPPKAFWKRLLERV